jgi:hypothetical protein
MENYWRKSRIPIQNIQKIFKPPAPASAEIRSRLLTTFYDFIFFSPWLRLMVPSKFHFL